MNRSRSQFLIHRTSRKQARRILAHELLECRLPLDASASIFAASPWDSEPSSDIQLLDDRISVPPGVISGNVVTPDSGDLRHDAVSLPSAGVGPLRQPESHNIAEKVCDDSPTSSFGSCSKNILLASSSTEGSVTMNWEGNNRKVVPGSWLVQLEDVASFQALPNADTAARVFNGGLDSLMITTVGSNGWLRITAPVQFSVDDIAFGLQDVGVKSLQPEFADYSALTIPDDPQFPNQYALRNNGFGLEDADIDAPEAWGHTGPDRGSTNVVVAINDSGVDYTHPDLYRNIWINQAEIPTGLTILDTDSDGLITFWDLNDASNAGIVNDINGTGYIDAGDILMPVSEGGWSDDVDEGTNGFVDDLIGWDFAHGDNDPFDNFFHGTTVAGIIGATAQDGYGMAGVVWKTQILVASGLDDSGSGTDGDLAAAIYYSVDNGARITNASWGGPYSELIDDAVSYADDAGHLVVVAAGNESNDNDLFSDFSFPSVLPYDNIISVGATDYYDFPAYFTNFGATSVDLMAPGDFIFSTLPNWTGLSHDFFSGTSSAAPHVVGAAALLWATELGASMSDIRTAILAGVDPLPDLDPISGYAPVASGGRLNLFGALQKLSSEDLFVVHTEPGEGTTVYGNSPAAYTVTFNAAVRLSDYSLDLQASDFLVNDIPASGVTLSDDGLTANFTFDDVNDPLTAQGKATIHITPSSVRRIDSHGTIPNGYEDDFRFDRVPLAVVAIEPTAGKVFPLQGSYAFRVLFNEPFDPDSLPSLDDYWLLLEDAGFLFIPSSLTPVLGNTALDVTFTSSNFVEGELTFYLQGSSIKDIFGNQNSDFFFRALYSIDISSVPYPVPILSRAPLGSLVAYNLSKNGLINSRFGDLNDFTVDSDDFTLDLDAGQRITVQVTPTSYTLQPRIELFNQANQSISAANASMIGGRVILQSVPISSPGIYTMRVSGLAGSTGRYSLFAALNVNLEEENRLAGITNDSTATAQNLDSSFITLSTDLAKFSRGAVTGRIGGAGDVAPTSVAFLANFEGGNDGFTVMNDNGLEFFSPGRWNRTDRRGTDPGHSANHSFWYDVSNASGDFDFGFQNAGFIVSPTIALPMTPNALLLDFNSYLETNGFSDYPSVSVSTDGGSNWTFLSIALASSTQWTSGIYDLSAYKGQSVQLRFAFAHYFYRSDKEGWYIDDVRIFQGSPRDYYSFTAKAGETVGLDVVQFNGGVSPSLLLVELLDRNGTTVLATGQEGKTNIANSISGITIPSTGTYFVRVTSPVLNSGSASSVFYTLALTRDVTFGLEPNNSAGTAQSLSKSKGAMGYVESPLIVSDAIDSGWYDWTGSHNPTNTNYFAGQFNNNVDPIRQLRDWFVFDIAPLGSPVQSARLELFLPGLVSPDPSETFKLFDVVTPVNQLIAGGSGLTGVFDDLGSGASYGSVVISAANNGTLVSIDLNAAGIAAIEAAQGGRLAIGGAVTTIDGTTHQSVFGGTSSNLIRRLVITPTKSPSDLYSVSLTGDQTALQIETRTPGDGPGEFRNNLNPRIEVYNATGTILIASGIAGADGRNEKIKLGGLAPNSTYQVRIFGEASTEGEYYLSATPLRVPAVNSWVDDGLPNSAGPDGVFHITNPAKNGWTSVVGNGWQNDFVVHQVGISRTPNNVATWDMKTPSAKSELFVTWIPRPTNATNATYQVFLDQTLLSTTVFNQTLLPNDGILFGNTYVASLGVLSDTTAKRQLSVKLITAGSNGDVIADAVFLARLVGPLSSNRPVDLASSTKVARINSLWDPSVWNAMREVPLKSRVELTEQASSQNFVQAPVRDEIPFQTVSVDEAFRSYSSPISDDLLGEQPVRRGIKRARKF